jgi:hypothetical protein|tara:strand:+ start:5883 stop:7136 length:1254 start_codon:yes stop_codon:yes gene_type:complete
MSLEILKKKYYRTSGNQNSNGMGLYNNEWVLNRESSVTSNEFYLPLFCGTTGTYSYYEQSPDSTLNLYGRVALDFYATGTTATTLPQGYVQNAWLDDRLMFTRFDVYKIPFEDHKNYDSVLKHISTPYIQYTATTATTRGHALSGEIVSDTFRYNFRFSPNQVDKPNVGYTEVIFDDRSQYFINPVYSFYNQTNEYSEAFKTNDSGVFSNISYTGLTSFVTKGRTHIIQQGLWSGNTVQGLFFVAMQPASKPAIEHPLPSGDTTTPAFFFSNVEDGDEYVLEVEYGGTSDFTDYNVIEQYYRSKDQSSQEQVVSYKGDQDNSDTTRRTTTIRTRRISAALIANQSYCWRIGNIKFITDLFGIKRSVITYSDINCSITEENSTIYTNVDNDRSSENSSSTDTSSDNQSPPVDDDSVTK